MADKGKTLIIGIIVVIVIICLLGVIAYYVLGFNRAGPVAGHNMIINIGNVPDTTLDRTKTILSARFNEAGCNPHISTARDTQGNALITLNYGNLQYDEACALAANGKFEMCIQTQGNDSAFILDSSDIRIVSDPTTQTDGGGQTTYGVMLSLTQAGADRFQQACIQHGATTNPENHYVMMLIDNKVFYSWPLSQDLANSLKTQTVDTMIAMTGTGDDGAKQAKLVYILMKTGALPVNTTIVESP